MLFKLLMQMSEDVSFFNVFRYITVRSALAGSTSFLLCIILGPAVIRKLQAMSIGQSIREEGPESHHKKAGTPTMGGVLIIVSVLCATLFC